MNDSKPSMMFNQEKKTGAGKVSDESSMLFHADSTDPEMRYFSGFTGFDAYIAFSKGNRKIAVAPSNEYGRMICESAFDEVLFLPDVKAEAAKTLQLEKGQNVDASHVVIHLAEHYQIQEFKVGSRFPAGLFSALQDAGIQVKADSNSGLFPKRQCKNEAEVEALRKANRASAAGFRVVAKTLAESKVKRGLLYHEGSVLTSERLRELIHHACLDEGAVALHTIAAVGDQAVDNHCVGYGPIPEGQLIVVDIFPQRIQDGYWGDMTRTYLKGKATDAQRRLVRTVRRAHSMATEMIKPGVVAGRVHAAIEKFFETQGYETSHSPTDQKGFFHDIGHGVGLEIHEDPFVRRSARFRFRKGMVVTVEPGLYYPGLGGARIEDVVHLVTGGNEKISSAPYRWEIP